MIIRRVIEPVDWLVVVTISGRRCNIIKNDVIIIIYNIVTSISFVIYDVIIFNDLCLFIWCFNYMARDLFLKLAFCGWFMLSFGNLFCSFFLFRFIIFLSVLFGSFFLLSGFLFCAFFMLSIKRFFVLLFSFFGSFSLVMSLIGSLCINS